MQVADRRGWPAADADSALYGDFGNAIHYRMCEEHPAHVDDDVVHGKLWLIGRAYAAAIERKAKAGFLLKHAARKFIEPDIDRKICSIAGLQRVNASNRPLVLEAHGYLTVRCKDGNRSPIPQRVFS